MLLNFVILAHLVIGHRFIIKIIFKSAYASCRSHSHNSIFNLLSDVSEADYEELLKIGGFFRRSMVGF